HPVSRQLQRDPAAGAAAGPPSRAAERVRHQLTLTAQGHYRPPVSEGAVVVIGGTQGIGLRLAETYAARGRDVVVTGRDAGRAAAVAAAIEGPGRVEGWAVDLSAPDGIASALSEITDPVDRLAVCAI